jgi:hypothetical protein
MRDILDLSIMPNSFAPARLNFHLYYMSSPIASWTSSSSLIQNVLDYWDQIHLLGSSLSVGTSWTIVLDSASIAFISSLILPYFA